MSTSITVRNLKNITSLEYEIPNRPGVYVITGMNGCGKTSLLVAIHRIAHGNAFKENYLQAADGMDAYANSEVKYSIDGDQVTYKHRNSRWVPTPRRKSAILPQSGITNSRLISTSGLRFFMPEKSKIPVGRHTYHTVSDTIINGMNTILNTHKFSNLKFIQLNMRLGRRPIPYRSDKLYVIKDGATVYSEYAFSLGERLLLNVLDYIDTVPNNSILLIDEIELALHPIAQTRLFDHLRQVSCEKRLKVFLTTHSASLIKHANKVCYLSVNNGVVTAIKDCTPAFVLKDVSADEEKNPDYIIFVEDDMARYFLSSVLRYSSVASRRHRICKIVQVGGYPQVMEMTKQFYLIPPFNNRKVCAFLDADVNITVDALRHKADKTQDELYLLSVVNRLEADNNLHYLNITPEIGVWRWIEADCSRYMSFLEGKYGEQLFNMQVLVNEVAAMPWDGDNDRKFGKSKLKNLAIRVMGHIEYTNIDRVFEDMMSAYAKYCMEDPVLSVEYIHKLESVLNR